MRVSILVALTILELAVAWGARRALIMRRASWLTWDGWFGWDKLDHGIGGFAALLALGAIGFWAHPVQLAWAFALVAVGVEVIEVARLATWVEKGRPQPQPALCDGVSYKDVIWDVAGALLAVGAIHRILP